MGSALAKHLWFLLGIAILCGLPIRARMLPPAHAATFPVPFPTPADRKIAGTYFEDHEGWHAGLDISAIPDSLVLAARSGEIEDISADLEIVTGENSSVTGPWSIQVLTQVPMYMLDVISVRRVSGIPVDYEVLTVMDNPVGSGFCDGEVLLVPNVPTALDGLSGGDVLEVEYAYYSGRIDQVVVVVNSTPEVDSYTHLQSIHKFIGWNDYPATADNRLYALTSPPRPLNRDPHPVTEGDNLAIMVESPIPNWRHLHFTMLVGTGFPSDSINPLSQNAFPGFVDAQNNRPEVQGSILRRTDTEDEFAGKPIWGDVDVFLGAGDDMGALEDEEDGDPDNILEVGVYNIGYYVEPFDPNGGKILTKALPLLIINGDGIDNWPGDAVTKFFDRDYQINNNRNDWYWVSHGDGVTTGKWRTRALFDSVMYPFDGSDQPATPFPELAHFADGLYRFGGKARDVVDYGADWDSLVTVDNFRPFIRQLVVKQQGQKVYDARWEPEPAGAKYQILPPKLADRQTSFALANHQLTFQIQVSESIAFADTSSFAGSNSWSPPGGGTTLQIRFDPNNALKLDPQGGPGKGLAAFPVAIDSIGTLFRQYDTLYAHYTISVPATTGDPTWDGDCHIILDLEDLSTDGTGSPGGGSGNRLHSMNFVDFNPAANALDAIDNLMRDLTSGNMKGSAGLDQVHRFAVDTQPLTIETRVEAPQ